MVLDLNGKVALITGGASGIGLEYAKDLLRNGVKGVTLADLNPTLGQKAIDEINKEFGSNKAIYVNTDVANAQQFEDAFKKTVEHFKYIDILINNAGLLNDAIWEKEISVNLNGVINGVILGLEKYLTKYKQDSEAVIVNISSVAAMIRFGSIPVYCGTKAAVVGLTRAWGIPHHYNRTNVRIIAVCPGVTSTPLIFDMSGRNLGTHYESWLTDNAGLYPIQSPEDVSTEVTKLIKDCENGSVWIIEGGKPAYEYILPERQL